MMAQRLMDVLNSHLSWTVFAVTCGVAGMGFGLICGRYSMRQTAIDMLQLALERAARDIRLFRNNRVGGIPQAASYRLLEEAEYLVSWRAQGANYLTRPTGKSRMRPPGEPRSRVARLNEERAIRRNQIQAFGLINSRPLGENDTGAVRRPDRINRRYNQ